MNHAARGLHESRFSDVVARLFLLNYRFNVLSHVSVCASSLHHRIEIVIEKGEEACAKLSVGGDPDAGAMAAERMRNRSDDADLANAVIERIAARGFACDIWNKSSYGLPC